MKTFDRLAKYMATYIGLILLSMFCSFIIAIGDLGYIQVLASTIDALKSIETHTFEKPLSIRFFTIPNFFDGIPFAIANLLPIIFNVKLRNYFFGTFFGIFLGLINFDTNKLNQSILLLLDGLKIAFFTSIVGMAYSLAFRGVSLLSSLYNLSALPIAKT